MPLSLPSSLSLPYTRFFFRNRYYFAWNLAALLANLALWTLFISKFNVLYKSERDFIALHYKVFIGVDLYSHWYYVFALPLAGVLVIAINYILSTRVYHAQVFSALLLACTSCIVQGVLYFALHSIIQINIF